MNNYNLKSIQKLSFFEAIRKHTGMYIGSKDADGLHHLVKEIISNSIDEYLNGNCSTIDVMLQEDGSIQISDNGRGIPIGEKENGKTALELCFTEEHAGGKFLNDTGVSGYNSSGGQHGIGSKCVNALSDTLKVISMRDKKIETIEFEDGIKKSHNIQDLKEDKTGLIVLFKPSIKYLETVDFDPNRIDTMLKEFSFLCKGLTFTFTFCENNGKEIYKYKSEKGMLDYLDYLNGSHDLLCKPLTFEEEEGTFKVEVAFGYNDTYTQNVKLFTNNVPQDKGTHLTGFKTAFTSCLNTFAKKKKWLKENDNNLAGSDFEEGQLLIINFKMIDPVFKGQSKEELTSSEGRTYVQRFANKALPILFERNEKEIKKIVDKALTARKAREAAKKARENVRTKGEKKSKLLNLPTKLVDCWGKNRTNCEILIAEGDSAASGLVAARDSEIQAVFPVRGKVLNCLKSTDEKIFQNQEIINIIKALGLELDIKTHKLQYDATRLRYGKILLAADADPDGESIKNLILTALWHLCPELVINGHIYATIPPLFRITTKKNEYIYLKDGAELENYKTIHKGETYIVSRNKGLGEQDAHELEECLLNPETRNITRITVADAKKANNLFILLMGKEVPGRREYLLAHSEEAVV